RGALRARRAGDARRVSAPPSCPACGEPLFGWVNAAASDPRSDETYVLDRCENCGLIARRTDNGGDPTPELAPGPELRLPNGASWQARIGGEHWAGLDLPAQRTVLNPRALELLLPKRGLRPARVRQTVFGPNQMWMWQTLLNAFTFHDNFAREVASGRLTPRSSRRNFAAFVIDALLTLFAALPVAIVALPLELIAVVVDRGGEIVVELAPAGVPEARSPGPRPA